MSRKNRSKHLTSSPIDITLGKYTTVTMQRYYNRRTKTRADTKVQKV